MIQSKQDLLTWADSQIKAGKKYWTIYRRGKVESGYPWQKSGQAETYTANDSMQDLRTAISIIGLGDYEMYMLDKPGNMVKGSSYTDFSVSSRESSQPVQGINGPGAMIGYVTKDEAMQMGQDMFEKMMAKKEAEDMRRERDELKRRVKELEDESDSAMNKFIGAITPVVSRYVNGNGTARPQPTARAAANEIGTPPAEDLEKTAERINGILTNTGEVFDVEDPIEFLEGLLSYVKANPHLIPMIKSMVK